MQVRREITAGDVLHVIVLLLSLIGFIIAGASWKQSMTDEIKSSSAVTRAIDQKVDALQGKVDDERNVEEDQLEGIDRRLSRVEGHLGMDAGDPPAGGTHEKRQADPHAH